MRLVPAHRVLPLPKSHSFPSGHSASAFAFATGVAMESPRLGIPLTALAGGVAFSRVYTGVHFPGDVLVGSAIGTGIAGAVGRIWRVARREPAEVQRKYSAVSERTMPRGEGLVAVVNPDAGAAMSSDPVQRIKKAFPEARIEEARGDNFEDVLKKVAPDATSLAVAGGDGSVNAAAKVALETGLPLALVPSGTLNHLALDLGMTSVSEGIEALEKGAVAEIDAAQIDGKVFLNAASIGVYPDVVVAREKLEPRLGKWGAVIVALGRVIRKRTPIRLRIDGEEKTVWSVFFGNCRYEPSGIAPAARVRLDDGLLDIRVVHASSKYPRTRLMLIALAGRLSKFKTYEEWTAKEVRIDSLDGPMRIACDGEVFEAESSLVVRKTDERLRVYVPTKS